MTADVEELLKKARSMGAYFRFDGDVVVVSAPQPLPSVLMAELRRCKAEVIELLTALPADACLCNPLPGQAEHENLAQAGCGPGYEQCPMCGYTWRCKICMGCRRCRFPG